jgi:hypothetical protein
VEDDCAEQEEEEGDELGGEAEDDEGRGDGDEVLVRPEA